MWSHHILKRCLHSLATRWCIRLVIVPRFISTAQTLEKTFWEVFSVSLGSSPSSSATETCLEMIQRMQSWVWRREGGRMEVGVVATHAVLHEASADNGPAAIYRAAGCKFSSCMKSRFSCISGRLRLRLSLFIDGTRFNAENGLLGSPWMHHTEHHFP